MQIKQPFRIRKDLDGYIVFFRGDAPLEMTEISAFVTGLLHEPKTMYELVEATSGKFPEADAKVEVDYTVQTLNDAGVLEKQ
ncbi:MAG: hypothetical protein Q7T41_03945 [Candidatus Saccharibacteria bacterium]|nr:hypothetical protein [Candidatus Saccharibacteria bacterium]